jgi:hypothetical protein
MCVSETQRDSYSWLEGIFSLILLKRNYSMGWAPVAVILTTEEAEIRRITVQSQPRQILYKTLP